MVMFFDQGGELSEEVWVGQDFNEAFQKTKKKNKQLTRSCALDWRGCFG
jgi:hypothetical protein